MQVTVLGPQRRPTLDQAVRSIDPDATIAVVTAGWQERELDDAELQQLIGHRGANLALHGRWLDVLDRDSEYAVAELEHRAVLDELQALYLIELDHALRALYAVSERGGRPRTRAAVLADGLAVVRLVDERHLARVREAHESFSRAWTPPARPVVAEHRAEVQGVLERSAGLVLSGGHVGVLLRVLRLFGVAAHVPASVVAWSAGAMALSERIVLFHDRAAHGPAHAEVYDDGLGLVPDAVLLPHARRRLRVDDPLRMSVLATRFAPARCVVLDDGVRIELGADGSLPPGARVVDEDGRIAVLEAS